MNPEISRPRTPGFPNEAQGGDCRRDVRRRWHPTGESIGAVNFWKFLYDHIFQHNGFCHDLN